MEKCDDILVQIVCTAYNQEKYIKQALDSFVCQKTNFKFEIIVHDDASTDKTTEIIKEYQEKYPDLIKAIIQTENQFSQGRSVSRNFIYPNIKAKYVALCEGDDYWIDENKLQKQIDFLESHPEYSGCFHPVKVIWENGEKEDSVYPSEKMIQGKKIITKKDLLKTNYIQTNSVVYRWRFINEAINDDIFPNGILPGDLYLHLLHAQVGNIAFLPDVMAVYRRNEGGIWFDQSTRILRFGLAMVKFHYYVWKNFANFSKKYLNRRLLPVIKEVINIYSQNQMFDKLEVLKETYGDLYSRALNFKEKKHRKSRFFFIVAILLLILVLVWNIFS